MKFKVGDIIQHKKYKSTWRVEAAIDIMGHYLLSTRYGEDMGFNQDFVESRFELKREILFEETMS